MVHQAATPLERPLVAAVGWNRVWFRSSGKHVHDCVF